MPGRDEGPARFTQGRDLPGSSSLSWRTACLRLISTSRISAHCAR